MRISPSEQEVIKRAAQECFDAAVVVRLFGSRVDDSKKECGIDLFIQTSLVDAAKISKAHTRFLAKPYAELGGKKLTWSLITPVAQSNYPSLR